jgi:hypothetical protein
MAQVTVTVKSGRIVSASDSGVLFGFKAGDIITNCLAGNPLEGVR